MSPRSRAVRKAAELERVTQSEGMRRTIATSLVHHFDRYRLPPHERPTNVLRAFVWEVSGDRQELIKLLTAIYRHHPSSQAQPPDGGVAAPY